MKRGLAGGLAVLAVGIGGFGLYSLLGSSRALEFLRGGVAATMLDTTTSAFKTQFSSEFTGDWWLLQGDGEMETGSAITLTPSGGTPTSQSLRVAGNGAFAATATAQRNTTSIFWDSSTPSPVIEGDHTVCMLYQMDSISSPSTASLVGRWGSVAADGYSLLWMSGSGILQFLVSNGAATTTATSAAGAVVPGALHFTCGVYDFITAGTSTLKIFQDGAQSGATISTGVAVNSGTSFQWRVARTNSAGSNFAGRMYLAFETEKVIADATIASMAATLLGATYQATASDGTALTVSRASPIACPWDASWTGYTTIPSGKPCVTMGGVLSAPTATDSLLRMRELDNAAWSNVGTPVVTANAVSGGDGALLADTIADDDGAAYEGRTQTITTSTTGVYTWQGYLANTSGSPNASVVFAGTGNAAGDATCNLTLSTTLARYTCSSGTYAAGITALAVSVRVGTATTATGTIAVDSLGVETGSIATPPIFTEASAVTRAAQGIYFPNPTGMSDTAGCLSATVYTFALATGQPRVFETGNGRVYYNSASELAASDATNFPLRAGATFAGATMSVSMTWGPGGLTVTRDGVTTTGSYDGTILGTNIALGGSTSGASPNYSIHSDVLMGTGEGACL